MAKKTREQLKAETKQTSGLRWEYARRNPDLIAEYDNLIKLAQQALEIPLEKMHETEKGKVLINCIQNFISHWQYHPACDPYEANPNPYNEEPPKKLLFELGSRLVAGQIPGIKCSTIKTVKCLTPLPILFLKTIPLKKAYSKKEMSKIFRMLHDGKGEIVKISGEMPSKILVEVDLINPKEVINFEFENLIVECLKILKFQKRHLALKPRTPELSRDIRIYDYHKKYNSFRKTIRKFFKDEDFENARRKVQKALKRAQTLIKGGYKHLS
jgi:hypothetical protein